MDQNRKVMLMKQVFEQDIRTNDRQSSKGNQLKWKNGHTWYKADYTGYEGLAEYMVSHLLQYSDLEKKNYVLYNTEEISYGQVIYKGCSSMNFLPEGWQLITLERLFQSYYGESLNKCIYSLREVEDRVRFTVEQTIRITGLQEFGKYMSMLLTVDALFLNEDRHTHNIAVLLDSVGGFHYCPVFDNGSALLSDVTMDYPMGVDLETLIDKPKAKTFSTDFDEQLEAAKKQYGYQLHFSFGRKEIEELLAKEEYYTDDVKQRVLTLLLWQRRKYAYLF